MKQIYLVYPKQTGRIAPEIYGHFTEHIGSVFYGGLWVGKDSAIPNERKKCVRSKFRSCGGPAAVLPRPTTGGTESEKTVLCGSTGGGILTVGRSPIWWVPMSLWTCAS